MNQPEYEHVRAFWEEWKRSSRPRTDPREAERLEMMVNLFLATADLECGRVDPLALDYIRGRIGEWRADLAGGGSSDQVILYRGLVDEQAVAARSSGGYVPKVRTPISFAYDLGSALGFARRGHIDGTLISIAVDLRDVVFSDREGFYKEGNADKEAEIVVVFSERPSVKIEKLRIPPIKQPHTSKSAREGWQLDVERLLALEAMSVNSSVP
jgi:hypothetical protein